MVLTLAFLLLCVVSFGHTAMIRPAFIRTGSCSWKTKSDYCVNFGRAPRRPLYAKDSIDWYYAWCPCCNITIADVDGCRDTGRKGNQVGHHHHHHHHHHNQMVRFSNSSQIVCESFGKQKDAVLSDPDINVDRFYLEYKGQGQISQIRLVCNRQVKDDEVKMDWLKTAGNEYMFKVSASWICPYKCLSPTSNPTSNQNPYKEVGYTFLGFVCALPVIYCAVKAYNKCRVDQGGERRHLIPHRPRRQRRPQRCYIDLDNDLFPPPPGFDGDEERQDGDDGHQDGGDVDPQEVVDPVVPPPPGFDGEDPGDDPVVPPQPGFDGGEGHQDGDDEDPQEVVDPVVPPPPGFDGGEGHQDGGHEDPPEGVDPGIPPPAFDGDEARQDGGEGHQDRGDEDAPEGFGALIPPPPPPAGFDGGERHQEGGDEREQARVDPRVPPPPPRFNDRERPQDGGDEVPPVRAVPRIPRRRGPEEHEHRELDPPNVRFIARI